MIGEGEIFEQTYHVTKAVYEGFIDTFADRSPLHVDAAFAAERGFPEKVMHGNILNGFLSHFVGECLPDKKVIILSEEIHYLLPVYLNDTLTLKVRVASYSEAVNAATLKFRFIGLDSVQRARGRIQVGVMR